MPQIIKDGVTYDLNDITEGDAFAGFIYCPTLYSELFKLDDFTIGTTEFTGAGTIGGLT